MGTRCEIDLIHHGLYKNAKNKIVKYTDRTRVYHHWDGNPDNIIPKLQKFINWTDGSISDNSYLAANFMFWLKLEGIHRQNSFAGDPSKIMDIPSILFHRKEIDPNNNCLNSFGVLPPNTIHDDIAYFYEVIITNKQNLVTSIIKYAVLVNCYKMYEGRALKKLNGLRGKLIKKEQLLVP